MDSLLETECCSLTAEEGNTLRLNVTSERTCLDASGPWVDASGPWVDASGPWVDASGPWVDASGPWVDASGPWVDASGVVEFRGCARTVTDGAVLTAARTVIDGAVLTAVTAEEDVLVGNCLEAGTMLVGPDVTVAGVLEVTATTLEVHVAMVTVTFTFAVAMWSEVEA